MKLGTYRMYIPPTFIYLIDARTLNRTGATGRVMWLYTYLPYLVHDLSCPNNKPLPLFLPPSITYLVVTSSQVSLTSSIYPIRKKVQIHLPNRRHTVTQKVVALANHSNISRNKSCTFFSLNSFPLNSVHGVRDKKSSRMISHMRDQHKPSMVPHTARIAKSNLAKSVISSYCHLLPPSPSSQSVA